MAGIKAQGLRKRGKREQIKTQIARWIDEQHLQPGDQILSQNELGRALKCTAVTAFKALKELESEGVVHRIDGKGTFVGPAPQATAVRTACLVLPGRDMDQPDANPDFWPYVRQLMHAFHDSLPAPWRFTTMAVLPGTRPEAVAEELALDDVVFFHHIKEPYELLKCLVDRQLVPVVAFGLPRPDLHCLTLDHDMVEGVRKSVAYLAGLGYRKIGYVGTAEPWGRFWFEGYRKGLADFGLPENKDWVVKVGAATQQEGARAAAILIKRGLPCEVVLTDSDMRALGLVEYLRHEGVRVPHDIGVMGYDGLENATRQPPFLTSLHNPLERMIRAGIEVAGAARGRATPDRHEKFVGDVVPGRTVMQRAGRGRTPAAAGSGKREAGRVEG
jgi:hypothetical protein